MTLLAGSLGVESLRRELAQAFLREEGILAEVAQAQVRKRFGEEIVQQYDAAHVAYLKERGGDLTEIQVRLRVNRGRLTKWLKTKDGDKPSWNTICLALAAFDVGFERGLPRGRFVTVESLRRCCEHFARDWLPARAKATLSRSDLVALHYGTDSVTWSMASLDTSSDAPQRRERAAEGVMKLAADEGAVIRRDELPRTATPLASYLGSLLDQWSLVWFSVLSLIPYDWKYKESQR